MYRIFGTDPIHSLEFASMDYTSKSLTELRSLCRERGLGGYSGKPKAALVNMLTGSGPGPATTVTEVEAPPAPTAQPLRQEVLCGDALLLLPTLPSESAQIVLADPPYNIGKDFGNASDRQPLDVYLAWCDRWIQECLRILKPNGTMFIYGFSEHLALILSRIPLAVQRRWLIWHYTNKNVPSLQFWQRSHESILVLWKADKVFHRDAVREPYTEGFLNGAAGRTRQATRGRFSKGDQTTTYTAHANGALPRDVLKIPALAGGAGAGERVNHPTQKPLALCDRLLRSCEQAATEGYVLVPFAGSGSECVAAKKRGLPFVGMELNPEYVSLIHERLAQESGPV